MNNFKHRSREWLYEQYIVLDRTGADIARECGIDKDSLYGWFKKFNFKKPKQGIKVPSTIDGKHNPAYYKLYYQKNREKILKKNRINNKKYINNLKIKDYREMILNLLWNRDNEICGICSNKVLNKKDASIDHILQVALGGDNSPNNLRLSHTACNNSRGRRGKRASKCKRIRKRTLSGIHGSIKSIIDNKQNPEYYKAYYKINKDRINYKNSVYMKEKRNYNKSYFIRNYRDMVIKFLWNRDSSLCGICNEDINDISKASIDHIVQRALGGDNSHTNIRLSHSRCNNTRPKYNKRMKLNEKEIKKNQETLDTICHQKAGRT